MAHSNRQKIRDARGGLTRNQARKAQTGGSSAQSTRLQETVNWLNKLEESKRVKSDVKVQAVINYPKDKRTIQRRVKVINRLENQLKSGFKTEKGTAKLTAVTTGNDIPLTESDTKRIQKELLTLKSRI
jgi:hypothetical protein